MEMRFDKILGRLIPKIKFDIRELEREKSSLEMHIDANVKWRSHTFKSMPDRLEQVNIDLEKLHKQQKKRA